MGLATPFKVTPRDCGILLLGMAPRDRSPEVRLLLLPPLSEAEEDSSINRRWLLFNLVSSGISTFFLPLLEVALA